jgi:probable rRNA maturation factor
MFRFIINNKKHYKFAFNIEKITKDITTSINKFLPSKKKYHFSISFINNKEIQKINKKHAKKNAPTDVLSFNIDYAFDKNDILLGDMYISYEYAKKYAKSNNLIFLEEIKLLITHGILHLLKYDHNTKNKQKKMFNLQEKILAN